MKEEKLLEELAYAYGCSTISEQAYQQIKEIIQDYDAMSKATFKAVDQMNKVIAESEEKEYLK